MAEPTLGRCMAPPSMRCILRLLTGGRPYTCPTIEFTAKHLVRANALAVATNRIPVSNIRIMHGARRTFVCVCSVSPLGHPCRALRPATPVPRPHSDLHRGRGRGAPGPEASGHTPRSRRRAARRRGRPTLLADLAQVLARVLAVLDAGHRSRRRRQGYATRAAPR